MIRRKKKSAAHIFTDARQMEDTTYYVRAEQPSIQQPESISQTSQEKYDTHSAPTGDLWTDRHGNRTIELAVGLGWQVAIIYLSTPERNASATQGSRSAALGLPTRKLVSKTIKSRTTSLGLTSDDLSQTWSIALSKLIDGDYKDETEARRLAQDLHLGLLESLSVSGKYMRPAYELGRLLSEAVLLAASADSREKPRVYRQLFDPLRLLPLAEWLAALENLLPHGAAQAVFGSLQNWSRWIAQAEDSDFDSADDFLREQARIWRDLLLGRILTQDLADVQNDFSSDSYTNRSLSESLADISLAAAFNNRSSLSATLGTVGMQPESLQIALRATRLPKHTMTAKDRLITDQTKPDDDNRQAELNTSSYPSPLTNDTKDTPVISQLKEELNTPLDNDETRVAESELLPPSLPISRFSLGVDSKIFAMSNSMSLDEENTATNSNDFKNDLSSLTESLNDGSENSLLSKLSNQIEGVAFDSQDFSDLHMTTQSFHELEDVSDKKPTTDKTIRNHPGFDIDIYENFDFDFAPGFAPDFMTHNLHEDIKDIVRRDKTIGDPIDQTSSTTEALIEDAESEPELLPFDISTLENFNINNLKPTFVHEDLLLDTSDTQDPPSIGTYENLRQPILTGTGLRQTPSVSRRRIKFLSLLFILFSLLFAARTFVVSPIEVKQNALPPIIKSGQWVLVSKLATSYQQGNIVYVTQPGTNIAIFARIIALPGEAITSSDGAVYVNGVMISDKKWYREMVGSCAQKSASSLPQEVVPNSYYVVMSSCSQISSQNSIGNPIPAQDISGKVIAIIWENSHPWFSWL